MQHLPETTGVSGDTRVVLRAGGRTFETTAETLISKSPYFRGRLSGRWKDADEDGSYFLDSDPAMIEHILRYLRFGQFPLLYDSTTHSFDYAQYSSLLAEAKFFGITALEEWIENECYRRALKVRYRTETLEGLELHEKLPDIHKGLEADSTLEFCYAWGDSNMFICPRALAPHADHPELCDANCVEAQDQTILRSGGKTGPLKGLLVKKWIEHRPEACFDGGIAVPESDEDFENEPEEEKAPLPLYQILQAQGDPTAMDNFTEVFAALIEYNEFMAARPILEGLVGVLRPDLLHGLVPPPGLEPIPPNE